MERPIRLGSLKINLLSRMEATMSLPGALGFMR
jgi:hypothetical protein